MTSSQPDVQPSSTWLPADGEDVLPREDGEQRRAAAPGDDQAGEVGILDAVADVLETQGRHRLVGARERGIDEHVLTVLHEGLVRIERAVARHAVGVQRSVHALEGVPEPEHPRIRGGLGGRVPRRAAPRRGLVGEAPDRRAPCARDADRGPQLARGVDVRAVLDRRREGAVEAPREHGPDVDVVAAAVVPQELVARAVRRDREAAGALPPRDRHAPGTDALRRCARS